MFAGTGGRWWPVLALVLLTLVAYAPAIAAGGFIWDDDDYLLNNENLRDVEGLVQLWTPRATRQYYPLVFTTFWVEHQLWGFHPAGYHLVNVLLHAVNAVLVWRLCRVLRLPGAWMIAAVFAVHPVHAESVAWITERKNVLSGCFYLLASLAYQRFDAERFDDKARDRAAGRSPWWWYAGALACLVAALLSKTVTCSLPAALVLALLWLRRPLSVVRLLPLAPMVAVGLALALHTAHLERSNVGAVGPEFDFTIADRLLIASRALAFYPWKLLVPWPLVFIYPRWSLDPSSLLAWWPLALALAVAAGAAVLYWRGRRGPALALAFFVITIFPALGFLNFYPMRYSFVADHFQYLASLGLIALAVTGLARLITVPSAARVVAGAWLLGATALTAHQCTKYAGAETLWRRTLAVNPGCWMCHNNLGNILTGREEYEAAMSHYGAALAENPDHYQSRWNIAATLDRLDRPEEAVVHWRELVMHHGARDDDWARLGASLEQAGRPDEALDVYDEALRRRPASPPLRLQLGRLLMSLERPDDALDQFEILLKADPGNVGVRAFVARLYDDRGEYGKALEHYRLALEHAASDTQVATAAFALARFLALCPDEAYRDPAEAVRLAEPVSRATGGTDPLVLDTLAAAYAGVGLHAAAVEAAESALARARSAPGYETLVPEIEARLESYREAAGEQ